mgnify:CR=1 FL=1
MNNLLNKLIIGLVFILPQLINGQTSNNTISVKGHVIDVNGEHIPFATVSIKGTTLGTTTDAGGHYNMNGLPEGVWIMQARSVGFKSSEREIVLVPGEHPEVNFSLGEDVLRLEEVTVTADRNETNRKESAVVVNTITPQIFNKIQAPTLSEGLNFTPGLRMENNCQNCGFTQVRMNGMKGPYSQILINNRPIFSGLAGVYGLELIPANMIERVEVVRGGGSALYGSNAIAGTINLILKDPINNSWEFGLNSALTGIGMDNSGDPAQDHTVSFNSSLVTTDNKTGIALYGFFRDRQPFDGNADEFSELSSMKNTTIGSRIFHRFGTRAKVAVDFFNINEERRGGNKFDEVLHMADIAEAVSHDITTGAVSFEHHFRKSDVWRVYTSGQKVNRDSYYGAEQALDAYGNSKDFTWVTGTQYSAYLGNSELTIGGEFKKASLVDSKLGFPDLQNAVMQNDSLIINYKENTVIVDQSSSTAGFFGQYEINAGNWQFSAGARYDKYMIRDKASDHADKSGYALSPRLTVKYNLSENLQARASYSQGYRAPQIFDEDLHIESSGARRVIHVNAPDLTKESSHSYMASLDFNRRFGKVYFSFLAEAFYTRLNDAFVNEYGTPDGEGTVIYTRTNAEDGAVVQGVNMEMNLVPSKAISIKGGFTLQSSKYEKTREFGEKKFFRTPDDYGYLLLDWQIGKNFGISTSANYTGSMLVPYFGPEISDPGKGELRKSQSFLDAGIKFNYDLKIHDVMLRLCTGVKNIFNAYQDDLDRGIDRDPGYFYGPNNPRTVYIGIKMGNMLR